MSDFLMSDLIAIGILMSDFFLIEDVFIFRYLIACC